MKSDGKIPVAQCSCNRKQINERGWEGVEVDLGRRGADVTDNNTPGGVCKTDEGWRQQKSET